MSSQPVRQSEVSSGPLSSSEALLARCVLLTDEDLEGVFAEFLALAGPSFEAVEADAEREDRRDRKGAHAGTAIGLTASDPHFVRRYLAHLVRTSAAASGSDGRSPALYSARQRIEDNLFEQSLGAWRRVAARAEVRARSV